MSLHKFRHICPLLDRDSPVRQDFYLRRPAQLPLLSRRFLLFFAVVELIQVCDRLSDPTTKERETRASLVAVQELNLANATIVTRDETDTLVDAGKSIHIIPFYRWAIE